MDKKLILLFLALIVVIGAFYFFNPEKKNMKDAANLNLGSIGKTASVSATPSASAGPSATPAAAPTTFPDGLITQDLTIGTGPGVKSGDTVVMNYIGTLENGQKFDSSYDRNQPFTTQIGVGQVIKGWDEGVVGMQVGGKRKLIIPAALGYGSEAVGPIPPNSTLIFEVELLSIK